MQSSVTEGDPNDRASTEEIFTLAFRVRDCERKLLRKIEGALQRIEKGTYGWCTDTGDLSEFHVCWRDLPLYFALRLKSVKSSLSGDMVFNGSDQIYQFQVPYY